MPVVFYPCTDENLINPLYVEADPIYGIWIYDPRDQTQLPIVPPEEGFMYTEVASADPRPVPPLILDQENRFLGDPDLVADGEAVLSIRNVYDFDGAMVVPDVDALANPAARRRISGRRVSCASSRRYRCRTRTISSSRTKLSAPIETWV